MKKFTSLFIISAYCFSVGTAGALISNNAKTPKQRCDVFARIDANNTIETDANDSAELENIYNLNYNKYKNDQNNSFFYLEPNKSCSNKYAQASYFTTNKPCYGLKVNGTLPPSRSGTPFCNYDPEIVIDKTMMQEYARATYPGAKVDKLSETNEQTTSADVGGKSGGRYPVVYWHVDKNYQYGQFVHGWLVKEIKPGSMSYKERAEQWCYARFKKNNNTVVWRNLRDKVDDGRYNCWYNLSSQKDMHNEPNGIGKSYCDDINKYISQMQKSASDSTLIGATAEWMVTSTVENKPNYDCVVTIPQQ